MSRSATSLPASHFAAMMRALVNQGEREVVEEPPQPP
jgi:hypothetical protein